MSETTESVSGMPEAETPQSSLTVRGMSIISSVLTDKDGAIKIIPLLLLEVEKENVEAPAFGFSETEKNSYVILNADLDVVTDEEVLAPLYNGLDAMHASAKIKLIDTITETISSEKHKLRATEILTASLGKVPKDKIVTEPDMPDMSGPQVAAIKKEFKKVQQVFTATAAGEGSTDTNAIIDRYAFQKHLMFVGEAGQGKTHSLSSWINSQLAAENIDNYIIADFHEGFEAPDMLGMMVPNDGGTLTWIDGPVTQAFRSAAAGQKTVLFCDEILRSPQRELSLLVGALTPKADGMFTLRTNRVERIVDGIGQTEEIKCSPENLWVVAASNVGAGFSVDEIDTAFKDRFRTFRIATASALVKVVSEKICKAKGFSPNVSKKLIEMFTAFQELKSKGSLQQTFSIRHVSEVLSMADKQEDIYPLLEDLTYTCLSINSNGIVNQYELELFESLIEPFQS